MTRVRGKNKVGRPKNVPVIAPVKKNPVGKPVEHTDEEIREALINNDGLLSYAAQELGYTYTTIFLRIQKSEELQKVLTDITETIVDKAEKIIFRYVDLNVNKKGRPTKQDTDIAFRYLQFKAKKRGYVERTESTGADGKPIEVEVTYMTPFSDDEIEAMKKQAEDFKKAVASTVKAGEETIG